ncbi:RabGAP/TBC [Hesseltinella vesiculosa]|uniref:RabGAP/TBC n=1 Tax=Hesseltinella vesiculosa TaxID=101127 RepID=A0A1X2GGR5_9FUNG|nr:RabGAP/TBC [Hesseltinella vesiculosa]
MVGHEGTDLDMPRLKQPPIRDQSLPHHSPSPLSGRSPSPMFADSIRRQRSDSFVHAYHNQVEQWQRKTRSSTKRYQIITTPNTSPLLSSTSQYSDSDQDDLTSLPPSLRITTNKQAFIQSSDNAGPILEGVLIRRAVRPASHLHHHKDDSSASSASPQEEHPLSPLGSLASPHNDDQAQPAPLLVDSSQPWQPPTLTNQTPLSLQQQLPSDEPHPSLVAKLLSKGEDSLFHRLTHRHHRLPQHDYNHDQMIYPPPTPLMDQDTELDQYGFQKASQWITLETCHDFERYYQPIMERRRQRWQVLLDEHNGLLLDRCLQVRRYIRKGVPSHLRGQVWLHYSGAKSKMDANPGVYDKFLKRAQEMGDTNEFADLIERDLHRTFPDNIQFSHIASASPKATGRMPNSPAAIQVLRRVLCTFSVYCPSIGYCQSLNFLVGMLLLFMKEEEAFWCLVTTVQNILPAGVYDVTMEGTSVDQTVLMMLVYERMPQFWYKLTSKTFWEAEQDGVSMPTITLVTSHWFLTLFINILPTETVLRVWDCFF